MLWHDRQEINGMNKTYAKCQLRSVKAERGPVALLRAGFKHAPAGSQKINRMNKTYVKHQLNFAKAERGPAALLRAGFKHALA